MNKLMIICVMIVFVSVMAFKPGFGGTYQTIRVQPGDTIWTLAEQVTTPDQDIRETIYHIERINHLTGGIIHPGQQLQVPVFHQ